MRKLDKQCKRSFKLIRNNKLYLQDVSVVSIFVIYLYNVEMCVLKSEGLNVGLYHGSRKPNHAVGDVARTISCAL